MSDLDRPRIQVDFNEMVEKDVVLLCREDTCRDSAGGLIQLREGMRVFLCQEDADDTGAPSYLLATGIAELNDAPGWSSKVRWRCRIDAWSDTPRSSST